MTPREARSIVEMSGPLPGQPVWARKPFVVVQGGLTLMAVRLYVSPRARRHYPASTEYKKAIASSHKIASRLLPQPPSKLRPPRWRPTYRATTSS